VNTKLVIIPTYKEEENIEKMVHTVFSMYPDYDILIVDDNSPDNTATLAKQMQKEFSGRLHLIEREGKLGLGTAYIAGFKFALERGYEYVFEMDCDFSHDPKDLKKTSRCLFSRWL